MHYVLLNYYSFLPISQHIPGIAEFSLKSGQWLLTAFQQGSVQIREKVAFGVKHLFMQYK
jgi:hypothetical protein